MLELRDYQQETVEQIRDLIRQGIRNILVVSPTGSGKTVIATHVLGETARKGHRALFVVDRLSLIAQTSQTLYAEKIAHGVIQADHPLYKPWELVLVCSQQTLARRKWPEASVIFVDEAHTVTKTVRERILPRDTVVIGLTATPFTKGLGRIYDAVVNVTTTNKLIAAGHLVPFRIFAPSEPDMTGVKVVAGEWEEKETAKRAMQVVGDCVVEYLKRGQGKKFICSAVNVDHVMELQRQFWAAGIVCATYTYKDLADDRADVVREFRKADSNIRGLITVTAASKGFDVPDIGVVIMARPLRNSLTEHIQFLGRGLRSAAEKSECLVLDHSGNCKRFWNDANEFFETGAVELDDGKKKLKVPKKQVAKEREIATCPTCTHVHLALPYCPACGFQYPPRPAVQHVPGTLAELVASSSRAVLTTQLWPQLCGYARRMRQTEESARSLAFALFKGITGVWPTGNFSETESVPLTREVANKIRSMNIAYARAARARAARV